MGAPLIVSNQQYLAKQFNFHIKFCPRLTADYHHFVNAMVTRLIYQSVC